MLRNPWIPHRNPGRPKVHPKQALFLLHDEVEEILYGGAAGGGKSDAALMGAAQYVDVPGYAALILRRKLTDLKLPGALIHRSKEWWHRRVAWNGSDHCWTFPAGAKIQFGYLENPGDEQRYRSSEFQYIAFDELTELAEEPYTFLFSRLRRPARGPLADVPLRVRGFTNPGGRGHEWVKKRFIPDAFLKAGEAEQFGRPWWKGGRMFLPARLEDNPSLDAASYERGLNKLDPVTRAQLRKGDWKAHAGGRFRADWWRRYRNCGDHYILEDDPRPVIRAELPRVATCDPANRKTKASKYTAGGVFGDAGRQRLLVLDIFRERLSVEEIIPRLHNLCQRWAPLSWAGIEANGFQMMLAREARDRRRYPYIPTVMEMDPEGKSKLTRATPAIIRAEQGLLYLPEQASWKDDFVAELAMFTGNDDDDGYTDQVDIMAYAVIGLDRYGLGGAGDDAELLGGGYRRR